MKVRKSLRLGLLTASLSVFVACGGSIDGGGTDGTGSPPPSAVAITVSGVMTKGSVIISGVRYNDSAATVTDDRGRTASDTCQRHGGQTARPQNRQRQRHCRPHRR